jgi:hypothetical protein
MPKVLLARHRRRLGPGRRLDAYAVPGPAIPRLDGLCRQLVTLLIANGQDVGDLVGGTLPGTSGRAWDAIRIVWIGVALLHDLNEAWREHTRVSSGGGTGG